MDYSGDGTADAAVQPVDVVIPPKPDPGPVSSTRGCQAGDFARFTEGNIVVIQRGDCTFGEKAELAQQAGASGVIIFNEGNLSPTPTARTGRRCYWAPLASATT